MFEILLNSTVNNIDHWKLNGLFFLVVSWQRYIDFVSGAELSRFHARAVTECHRLSCVLCRAARLRQKGEK